MQNRLWILFLCLFLQAATNPAKQKEINDAAEKTFDEVLSAKADVGGKDYIFTKTLSAGIKKIQGLGKLSDQDTIAYLRPVIDFCLDQYDMTSHVKKHSIKSWEDIYLTLTKKANAFFAESFNEEVEYLAQEHIRKSMRDREWEKAPAKKLEAIPEEDDEEDAATQAKIAKIFGLGDEKSSSESDDEE